MSTTTGGRPPQHYYWGGSTPPGPKAATTTTTQGVDPPSAVCAVSKLTLKVPPVHEACIVNKIVNSTLGSSNFYHMYTLDTYLKVIVAPQALLDSTVDPWSEKLPFGHDPGVHFEHHVDPKFRKNHQEPKKVGQPKPSWTPLWTPW